MMCSARLIRRLPARESRCLVCSPEEASSGAVPFHDANLSRSANRWMSPTSTSSRAALEGPIPVSVISEQSRASTSAVSSFLTALIFLSMVSSSTISSTARGLAACRPPPRPYRGRLPRLAGPGTRMHGSCVHGPRLRHVPPPGHGRRMPAYAALAAHARAFRPDRPDLGVARSDVAGLVIRARQQAQ
jgi:hypothetical protein